jgi:hypothetical protein
MQYLGKPLGDYSLLQLENILNHFEAMLTQRNEASRHEKFNKSVGKKKAMKFPPAGIAFCELKKAIEEEIKSR